MPTDPDHGNKTTKFFLCGVEGAQTPKGALTREHVYSNWMRRFVPRTMSKDRRARLAKSGNLISDAHHGWAFFMWRWNAPHLDWI
jgi:hypothetical protein